MDVWCLFGKECHTGCMHRDAVLAVTALIALGCAGPQPTEDDAERPIANVASQEPAVVDAGDTVVPAVGSDDAGGVQDDGSSTVPGLKVAFFGDQGVGANARAVLELVKNEHANAAIHLGDFSYDEATPTGWDTQIDNVLGRDFPYFAVIGNHDVPSWTGRDGFAQRLTARLQRIADAHCDGEYGVKSSCTFRGLAFVLSGVGTYGKDHETYLESTLSQTQATFRLCIWHKDQHDMQVGDKIDEVGWEAYRVCARHGVPVITGHEHSYARSQGLAAIGDRNQGHGATGFADPIALVPGETFVAVSGLGGESRRPRTADHKADSWWASIYAENYQLKNGVLEGTTAEIQYGVLFVEFHVDGNPRKARAYFKTTDGAVHDSFSFIMPEPS